MNKRLLIVLAAMLLILGACAKAAGPEAEKAEAKGQSEQKERTAGESPADETEEAEEEGSEEMTPEELFRLAIDAFDEIQSFSANNVEKTAYKGEEVELEMEEKNEIGYTADPRELVLKTVSTGSTSIDWSEIFEDEEESEEESEEGSEKIRESYYTENGLYLLFPEDGVWVKLTKEDEEKVLDLDNFENRYGPSQRVKGLQDFSEDFLVEEDEENYKLKLSSPSDRLKGHLTEQFLEDFADMLFPDEETGELTFKDIAYEIYLDKETLFPSKIYFYGDVIAEGTYNSAFTYESESEYENYNNVDRITLTKEDREMAVEVTAEELAYYTLFGDVGDAFENISENLSLPSMP